MNKRAAIVRNRYFQKSIIASHTSKHPLHLLSSKHNHLGLGYTHKTRCLQVRKLRNKEKNPKRKTGKPRPDGIFINKI